MNRIGQSDLHQYIALAEDRRQALREAAETYRLACLARQGNLSTVQRVRLQLGRLLMALGRRLANGLEDTQLRRSPGLAR